jgi:probable H4MPT-linked C1 transfer pathway protein
MAELRLALAARHTVGWDVGGAHVKACVSHQGRVLDVVQWPCPLWLGLDRLQAVLALAHQRWPGLALAQQVLTMTGEMADFFPDRQHGVQAIAQAMAAGLAGDTMAAAGPAPRLFAGPGQWRSVAEAGAHWAAIASANWLATAHHAARHFGQGVLVDIGSTTTDLITFNGGTVTLQGRSDAGRLASGELVYQGVARTPLCALGQRVPWQGQVLNLMNEFFATSADVYRLLGELPPEHDQHPAADNGAKTLPATRARLARMIGLDARDGRDADWLALAGHWRQAQVAEIAGQLQRLLNGQPLRPGAVVVSAGCGDFLLPAVLAAAGLGADAAASIRRYADHLAPRPAAPGLASDGPADTARWAQVAAPAVAVALLWQQEHG